MTIDWQHIVSFFVVFAALMWWFSSRAKRKALKQSIILQHLIDDINALNTDYIDSKKALQTLVFKNIKSVNELLEGFRGADPKVENIMNDFRDMKNGQPLSFEVEKAKLEYFKITLGVTVRYFVDSTNRLQDRIVTAQQIKNFFDNRGDTEKQLLKDRDTYVGIMNSTVETYGQKVWDYKNTQIQFDPNEYAIKCNTIMSKIELLRNSSLDSLNNDYLLYDSILKDIKNAKYYLLGMKERSGEIAQMNEYIVHARTKINELIDEAVDKNRDNAVSLDTSDKIDEAVKNAYKILETIDSLDMINKYELFKSTEEALKKVIKKAKKEIKKKDDDDAEIASFILIAG